MFVNMFDNDPLFCSQENYNTSKEKRKIKKLLFLRTRDSFSDLFTFRRNYYCCVSSALANPGLEGTALDRAIVQCKLPLLSAERQIAQTNTHARIKVKRCIQSKRARVRQWGGDLSAEEDSEWSCLNRYHRRYLSSYRSKLNGN